MSRISDTSADLLLLDCAGDLRDCALELAQMARRRVRILSTELDPYLYDSAEFSAALSQLLRRHPSCDVQLLVKDTKPLIERGHTLVRLAQRLPSKLQIRRTTQPPENTEMAFMLVDNDKLLYKNDDSVYQGFANYAAGAEVKNLHEQFERLWQFSEPDPNLRALKI